MFTGEKILERDRFKFPAKNIFANNSKIIDWRAIYKSPFVQRRKTDLKTQKI